MGSDDVEAIIVNTYLLYKHKKWGWGDTKRRYREHSSNRKRPSSKTAQMFPTKVEIQT